MVFVYLQLEDTPDSPISSYPDMTSPSTNPRNIPQAKGTGKGLLPGAATVGLFKQNGTFPVLNLA